MLNKPACPATPPIRRAVGSWTTPRSIWRSAPSHGHENGRHGSVGAIRALSEAAGRNCVSFIAERIENLLLREPVQRQPAHPPDDVAEEEEVDVAVDEALRRAASPALPRSRSAIAVSLPVHASARSRSGRSPEVWVSRWRMVMSRLAVALEPGHERRDPIAEAQLAALDQHHHAGRRRHHLGERGEVEHRVERHRLDSRHQRALPDRLLIQDPVAAPDQHHRSGQLLLGDRLLHQRLDRSSLRWSIAAAWLVVG